MPHSAPTALTLWQEDLLAARELALEVAQLWAAFVRDTPGRQSGEIGLQDDPQVQQYDARYIACEWGSAACCSDLSLYWPTATCAACESAPPCEPGFPATPALSFGPCVAAAAVKEDPGNEWAAKLFGQEATNRLVAAMHGCPDAGPVF
jgi:hypothetical protein